MPFTDVLVANASYSAAFHDHQFSGKAKAGIMILTCMDSRIEPLAMIGLEIGDAKILRTPGAHLTPDALMGCILGVHTLNVDRIMIVTHTRCAMANSDAELRERVATSSGINVDDLEFGADSDRFARLATDLDNLRKHPLLGPFVEVGGFDYDVDSGCLTQVIQER